MPRKASSSIQTAKGIARIYNEMNFDAVNIGPNDLTAGLDFLKQLDFLPWVSANYYDNSGSTIFKPYILKTDGQLKYAIIGLSPPPLDTSEEYTYRSWQDVLTPLLQELKSKAHCIILLSSLTKNENTEIAHKYPEIRLIFSSLSNSGNSPPLIINKALVTQTANRGKYLGHLFLLNPGLYDWADNSTRNSTYVKKQRKALEYRLSRIDSLINQNDNNADTLATLDKQKTAILKQLQMLESYKANEPGASKSTFKAAFTPLTSNIEENRKINAMIKEIKTEAESIKN